MATLSQEHEERAGEIARRLSAVLLANDLRAAVAESLTGGKIATQLAAAPDSGAWFAGGVVCYSAEVKRRVLGVPHGPVISQQAVETMARSVGVLMAADLAVATSGAGGPTTQEGQEPGTTWLAVLFGDQVHSELHHVDGEPLEILARTEERALEMLWEAATRWGPDDERHHQRPSAGSTNATDPTTAHA
ncbi:CinA family protein [Georgenia sp. Z1491]|uniref:CinA family protein n=1 Tax=Georgenia sp. Z1491 TaxID=3416707 RepID=UPI003CEEF5D1